MWGPKLPEEMGLRGKGGKSVGMFEYVFIHVLNKK